MRWLISRHWTMPFAGEPPHDYRIVATVTDLYATFLGLDAKQTDGGGKATGYFQ